jgi:CARDB
MLGKRTLLAGGVTLAAAFTSGSVMAAPAPPPSTQLTSAVCHRALLPTSRKIAITAVMRPVNGTVSMAMMFDLQRARSRFGPFASVRGGGLDRWIHPGDPTLGQRPGDIWKDDQKVENLAATAYYRFRVRFRWTGTGGHPLATSTASGPTCFEPELRPDLLVRSLTVKPVPVQAAAGQSSAQQSASTPAQDRYIAVIANRGRTAAGAFGVELIVPSKPAQTLNVGGLGSHATVRETFTAPACTPGSRLTVVADPGAAVLDYNRANNTLTVQCPSATTARRYTR